MRFFKDFVTAVDENAAKQIIDNMCNVRDKKQKKILFTKIFSNYSETTNM